MDLDRRKVREKSSLDTPWPSMPSRPLSDIREITEPSLLAAATTSRTTRALQPRGRRPPPSLRLQPSSAQTSDSSSSPEQATTPEASSCYTIPHSSIPRRSSSQTHSRRPSQQYAPLAPAVHRTEATRGTALHGTIPSRGQSISPVKEAQLRFDPVLSNNARRLPSRTVVRRPHPVDILEHPVHKHSRVRLELKLSAPLFVGGGTIEGVLKCVVDDNERRRDSRPLAISSLSIDVLGFESVETDRRAVFLSLGVELIDADHPPPPSMWDQSTYVARHDNFVPLTPSSSFLPFAVDLPLDSGPPPFQSKHVSVRYLLAATAIIRDAIKVYRVRVTEDIQVLPTYDPETALASLPRPLTAREDLCISGTKGAEHILVTAGLHRQVWVSGGSVFTDVHVVNKSQRHISKLELALEQTILCYRHPKAGIGIDGRVPFRLFDRKYSNKLSATVLRANTNGWHGVKPYTSETRTCEIEIPRNLASVTSGKYFEVHYFLDIIAVTNSHKRVPVHLPITLIHLNSIDIMPNAIGQVAAAMAGQKRRQPRLFTPGYAFAAPRQQSLDRSRAQKKDLRTLCHIIDNSPRKNAPSRSKSTHRNFSTPWTVGETSSSASLTEIEAKEAFNHEQDTALQAFPRDNVLPQVPPKPSRGRLHERLRIRPSLDSIQSRLLGKNQQSVKGSIGGPRIVLANTVDPRVLGLRETMPTTAGSVSKSLSHTVVRKPSTPSISTALRKENQGVELDPLPKQHNDVPDAAGWI